MNFDLILFYKKDLIASVGRARIEEQKQTALDNIKKNREAALKKLDVYYKSWDQAKTSIGYIGITFLAVLFGGVFVNDFAKVCIHYFGHLRDLWRRCRQRKSESENEEEENGKGCDVILEIDQEYTDELEESLEKVYIKLLKAKQKSAMTFK